MMAEWQDIDLTGHAGVLYDSPSVRTRHAVDIATFPPLNADGLERRVYNEDGLRLPRRRGMAERGAPSYGVLVNLRRMESLYNGTDALNVPRDDQYGPGLRPARRAIKYFAYPQACLLSVGHCQANGVIPSVDDVVYDLNYSILGHDPDADAPSAFEFIWASTSQMYNVSAHRYRAQGARYHDAQRGELTALAAGTYATSTRTKSTAQRYQYETAFDLPHQRFSEKIKDRTLPRDIRLENVYILRIDRLQRDNQTGT